jgi:DNA-binding NarL/FixJ family response regulator
MERYRRPIFVVDDDLASRAAVAAVLERAGYVTRQALTGEEALEMARLDRPSLVILETHLPGASGYETLRELRETYGESLPVIFVSHARTEETDLVAGLLLGADDYLVKPVPGDRLLARVRRLVDHPQPVQMPPAVGLTPREQEVLGMLAQGLAQDQIAARLVIAPKTVAKHIERILSNLGVRSRAQAVALALRVAQQESPMATSEGSPPVGSA